MREEIVNHVHVALAGLESSAKVSSYDPNVSSLIKKIFLGLKNKSFWD